MKKAIVLGGTSAHISLIKNLKNRGYYTILVDYLDNPLAKEYCNVHYCISTLDKEMVLGLAKELAIDLVIGTCGDQINVTACYVAELLGLPAPYSYKTSLMVTDKELMKQRLFEEGINTPKYYIGDISNKFDDVDLNYPLVVKPVDGCGSKGVYVVRSKNDFLDYSKVAYECSRSKRIIIEEFIEGREIVVDAFVQSGIAQIVSIYEKFNIFGSKTVIQCYKSIRPIDVSLTVKNELNSLTNRIVDAFEIKNSTLFIQTIVSNNDVNVIEFAARAAGGLACRATELSCGFDAVDATVKSYLGERIVHSSTVDDGFIYSTNSIYALPCIFDYVVGYKDLLKNEVIYDFVQYKNSGSEIIGHMASSERIAGFIIKASNEEELFKKTDIAIKSFKVFDKNGHDVMFREPFENLKFEHLFL